MDVPFTDLENRRRLTQRVLFAIIMLTLPCYCIGAVMLAVAPSDDDSGDVDVATRPPLLTSQTVSPTTTRATGTVTIARTPTQGSNLENTPGQFIPRSRQIHRSQPIHHSRRIRLCHRKPRYQVLRRLLLKLRPPIRGQQRLARLTVGQRLPVQRMGVALPMGVAQHQGQQTEAVLPMVAAQQDKKWI